MHPFPQVATVANVPRHRVEARGDWDRRTVLDLEPGVIRGQVIKAREGRTVTLFNRGGAEQVGLQEELREIRAALQAGEIPAEEVPGIDTLIA